MKSLNKLCFLCWKIYFNYILYVLIFLFFPYFFLLFVCLFIVLCWGQMWHLCIFREGLFFSLFLLLFFPWICLWSKSYSHPNLEFITRKWYITKYNISLFWPICLVHNAGLIETPSKVKVCCVTVNGGRAEYSSVSCSICLCVGPNASVTHTHPGQWISAA